MNGATRLLESSSPWLLKRMQFWLIVRGGAGRLELRTTELTDGRRALGIFSYEEEARLFLAPGTRGGWRVRAIGIEELVSVLSGPCGEAESVVLDPLPQGQAEELNSLLCMGRERFADFLRRKGSGHEGG